MDAAIEKEFTQLQQSLNSLKQAVEHKLDESRQDAAERSKRRQDALNYYTATALPPFHISSIVIQNFLSSGPWTVKWIETDGMTVRRYERDFTSRHEAQLLLMELQRRRGRERAAQP